MIVHGPRGRLYNFSSRALAMENRLGLVGLNSFQIPELIGKLFCFLNFYFDSGKKKHKESVMKKKGSAMF